MNDPRPTSETIATLHAAIEAQERLRGTLPDAVVDATVNALRQKLAEVEAGAAAPPLDPHPDHRRTQVTLLFADIVGSTRLAQQLADPERQLDLMNEALRRLSAAVEAHGGQVAALLGDGLLGVFGLPAVQEDDAERAVRAGLAIRDAARVYAAELRRTLGLRGFEVRVGINTGLVATSSLTGGDEAFMGLAVNLAARLESAAEPGTVLISHFTYSHVRGIFDVLALEPVRAKGFPEPVPVYLVNGAKPRAFRLSTRGVEGVETRMVGRDDELFALQHAYADATRDALTQLVLVCGEAGVGKSRLLYEFDNWIELRPEKFYFFKGRSTPSLQRLAFGLFRDLFANRFDILDSDSPAAAMEKFRAGFTAAWTRAGLHEAAGPPLIDRADLVGHWLGFDFSASPAVGRWLGNPELGAVAVAWLADYFRALLARQPVVTFLEDIHWADAASIDLLHDLLAALPDGRWLIVGLTRSTFFEERPGWGSDLRGFSRLVLDPLSPNATRALVAEILQKAASVPPDLLELIVGTAEGNPFYVEELVKMLIDEGVIVPGEEQWAVYAERLRGLRIPSTLTGVLQARLDSLPETERVVLQRASVIGRSFWDSAVAALVNGNGPGHGLRPILRSIHERELILRRERSAFAGTEEFIFKHALLRDVTYETVPLRRRREYHTLAARWLEANAGERLGEYFEVVAEHFALAGDHAAAADYLERAAEQALRASAFRPALDVLFRAVDLLGMDFDGRPMLSAGLQIKLAETCWHLGEFTAAEVWAESARAEARRGDDIAAEAEALYWLSQAAVSLGDYERAESHLSESLPLARRARPETLARVLYGLGDVGSRALPADHTPASVRAIRAYLEESLDLARTLDNMTLQLFALNRLGALANQEADYTTAGRLWSECLALALSAGNRERQAAALTNLGFSAFFRGDLTQAADYTCQALAIDRDLGRQDAIAHDLLNLAEYRTLLGDLDAARRDLGEGLGLAWQSGTMPRVLHGLFVYASMRVRRGDAESVVGLLRLLRRHPAADSDLRAAAAEMLAELGHAPHPVPALDLDDLIARVLAGLSSA